MLELLYKLSLWLIVCFCIIFCVYVFKVYGYWKKRGIKYEQPIFPFGNLKFLMRKSIWEYFRGLKKRTNADYIGIYLGLKPALVVQSSELAKRILTKDFDYFQNRFISSHKSDPLGSLNIFTLKNPMWKEMRHEISPLFTIHRLKYITELMNVNATQLVKKIERDYIHNEMPVNLKELFSMYTSDTVAYTVFGIRVSTLSDQPSPLWCITRHMVDWKFWRGFELIMMFLVPAVAAFLKLNFFSEGATKYIKDIFWSVVKQRQETRNPDDKDLVNHLLKLKENLKLPASAEPDMADKLMLAQVAVFILGSIETSTTALSYCLHELAYHPEEQAMLFEEVSDALKESGKHILNYEELLKLNYLSACIYETLRKHTPVSYLDRKCVQNYKLNDEITIDKDTPVLINIVAIHYDEQNYPQPTQWRPDRFRNASDGDNLQFTFLPFGEGPRFCIGKRYGMMQVRAALAQIIVNYRIEPDEPYEITPNPYCVFLAPTGGGRVKFVPRQ